MYYFQIENIISMHLLTGEPTGKAEITESKNFKRCGEALGEGLQAMYALVLDKNKKTYGLVLRVCSRIHNQKCLFYCDVKFDNHGGNLNVESFLGDNSIIPQEVWEVGCSCLALICRSQGSLYRQFKDAKKFAKAIDDAERNIEK